MPKSCQRETIQNEDVFRKGNLNATVWTWLPMLNITIRGLTFNNSLLSLCQCTPDRTLLNLFESLKNWLALTNSQCESHLVWLQGIIIELSL